MNEPAEFYVQNKTAHISSFNKTPVAIIQEYAVKKHLVPEYTLLLNDTSSINTVFKYRLKLDGYETEGEGSSKKEARQVAASKLVKIMIDCNPNLLKDMFKGWDLDNHVVSPFDNTIKINAIGQLNSFCINNNLGLPDYKVIREEGQSHARLFTISCRVSKMVERATHTTKKQAKHLAAFQMMKKLTFLEKLSVDHVPPTSSVDDVPPTSSVDDVPTTSSVDDVPTTSSVDDVPPTSSVDDVPSTSSVDDVPPTPNDVLTEIEMIKNNKKNNIPMEEDICNYHLLFKKQNLSHSVTLNNLLKQYFDDGKLCVSDPFNVLNKIVEETEMILTCNTFKTESELNLYMLSIESVYPSIVGLAINEDIELAKVSAAHKLLENICILSK